MPGGKELFMTFAKNTEEELKEMELMEAGWLIIRRFAELTGITDMESDWDYDPFEAV